MAFKKSKYETLGFKTFPYGLQFTRHLGPKTWKPIPDELKELPSLGLLKEKFEFWDVTMQTL